MQVAFNFKLQNNCVTGLLSFCRATGNCNIIEFGTEKQSIVNPQLRQASNRGLFQLVEF